MKERKKENVEKYIEKRENACKRRLLCASSDWTMETKYKQLDRERKEEREKKVREIQGKKKNAQVKNGVGVHCPKIILNSA